MSDTFKIIHYERNGHDIFQDWLDGIKDYQGRNAIQKRIDRIEDGNFGNHHFCRDEVWELVIDKGPGYRVYYSMIEDIVVLLLCAGDKSSQQKDISKAVEYLHDFKERN